jgi:hypothetical protein
MEPLTKMDLAALRKADATCFDHNARGVNQIRAIKRHEPTETDPYATDVTHRVVVDSTIRSYVDGEFGLSATNFQAFEMMHSPREHWLTVLAFLRVGDVLQLSWIRGSSTGYLQEAGLHRDELYLLVWRNGKESKFMIDVSITPDNTARMTQRVY